MPEIIEEHDVYTGWLRIIRRKIRHANGGVQEYEIVNPDSHAACAVVLDQNQNVVLVEMYRFGHHMRLLELPGGAVAPAESAEDAVRREVLEETGYAGELSKVGTLFIAAEHGVTRHVFVMKNSIQISAPTPEQSEIDEGAVVRIMSLEAFRRHVRTGKLSETGAAFMALDYLGLLSNDD